MVLNFGLSEILSLESGVYIFGLQAPPLPTHLASHCSKLSATGKCRTEQGETRTGRSAHGGSPAGRTSKTSSSWTKPSMKVLKWLLSTFHHLSYWERHCARFVNDLTMWQCDNVIDCMPAWLCLALRPRISKSLSLTTSSSGCWNTVGTLAVPVSERTPITFSPHYDFKDTKSARIKLVGKACLLEILMFGFRATNMLHS